MNTPCREWKDKLTRTLSGGLSEPEEKDLQAHLEQCGACRSYLKALKNDDRVLSQLADDANEACARIESTISFTTRPLSGASQATSASEICTASTARSQRNNSRGRSIQRILNCAAYSTQRSHTGSVRESSIRSCSAGFQSE